MSSDAMDSIDFGEFKHEADRRFAYELAKGPWSSIQSLTDALKLLKAKQREVDDIDRTKWVYRVVDGLCRRVLPKALREAARAQPLRAEYLEDAARFCEERGTVLSARSALKRADDLTLSDRTVTILPALAAAVSVVDAHEAMSSAPFDRFSAIKAARLAVESAVYVARSVTTPVDKDNIFDLTVSVAIDSYDFYRNSVRFQEETK